MHSLSAQLRFAFGFLAGFLPASARGAQDQGTESAGAADLAAEAASAETPPNAIDPDLLRERRFGEAPMLARQVEAGQLPPVGERLPENPKVVRPVEQIGVYGGTIRRALRSEVTDSVGIFKTLSDSLFGFSRPLPHTLEFNLAESFEYSDGGRKAVVRIREGVKWSDGSPFTVDDILFWYEDMLFDDEARAAPLFPSEWLVGGEPVLMEKVDDHTLAVSADQPMGRIKQAFAKDVAAFPKRYYKQFHPRYNPEATYREFRRITSEAWLACNPDAPRLTAWHPVSWSLGQRIVFERNPYYWKVDTAGNQLPYADQLTYVVMQNLKIIQLKFMNGELDLIGRYGAADMYATMVSQEPKSPYRVRLADSGRPWVMFLNWDSPDEALRSAFRDRRVRLALSLAVDRDEINDVLFHGRLLKPYGFTFSPLNPLYDEAAAMAHVRHDPERSRALLEEAGYRDGDGDGYREFPDGRRMEVVIDANMGAESTPMVHLVADYWEAVGVRTHTNIALLNLVYPRRLTGVFDVFFAVADGAEDPLGRPNLWAMMTSQTPFWHRDASQDPPPFLEEATRRIKAAMGSIDEQAVREHLVRVRDLYAEAVPGVAIGELRKVWGAHTRLGNVPEEVVSSDVFRGWSRPVFHEQLFIRLEPSK